MTAWAQAIAAWPVAASMAATVLAQGLRAGRRRSSANLALHELRRPLQLLALSGGPGTAAAGEGPVELAAAALDRLDRAINGDPAAPVWGRLEARPLLVSAVGRWQARARVSECSLELRWNAGGAAVDGDRFALAQALDNLIVNAIEHGGSSIVVAARLRDDRLRIAVADSGAASRPASRRGNPTDVIAWLSGRRRRGHGLAVVRGVASAHGGRFALRLSERGTLAILELPLAEEADLAA